jgi:hypothetical protein
MANIDYNPSFLTLLKKHLILELREAFREAISAPMSGNLVERQNARAKHVLDGIGKLIDTTVEKAVPSAVGKVVVESRAPSRSASGGLAGRGVPSLWNQLTGVFWSPQGGPAASSEGSSSPSTPVIARSRSASEDNGAESRSSSGPSTTASRAISGASAASRATSVVSPRSWGGGRGKTRRTGRSKTPKQYSK